MLRHLVRSALVVMIRLDRRSILRTSDFVKSMEFHISIIVSLNIRFEDIRNLFNFFAYGIYIWIEYSIV